MKELAEDSLSAVDCLLSLPTPEDVGHSGHKSKQQTALLIIGCCYHLLGQLAQLNASHSTSM